MGDAVGLGLLVVRSGGRVDVRQKVSHDLGMIAGGIHSHADQALVTRGNREHLGNSDQNGQTAAANVMGCLADRLVLQSGRRRFPAELLSVGQQGRSGVLADEIFHDGEVPTSLRFPPAEGKTVDRLVNTVKKDLVDGIEAWQRHLKAASEESGGTTVGQDIGGDGGQG